MAEEPGTDLGVLRGQAYATPDKLSDRTAIYAYRTGPGDLRSWTLSQVDWPAGRDGARPRLRAGHPPRPTGRSCDPTCDWSGPTLSEGMLAAVRAGRARAR